MVTRKKRQTSGENTEIKSTGRNEPAFLPQFNPDMIAPSPATPEASPTPLAIDTKPISPVWPNVQGHFDLNHALQLTPAETQPRFDEFDIPDIRFSTRPERYQDASLRIDREVASAPIVHFGTIGKDMGWATVNVTLNRDLLLSKGFFSYFIDVKSNSRIVISPALRLHPKNGQWVDKKLRSQVIGPDCAQIADAVVMDFRKIDIDNDFVDPVLFFHFPLHPFLVTIKSIIVE